MKYRKKFDDEAIKRLGNIMLAQVKAWGKLYLLMFRGESGKKNYDTPADYMRIACLFLDGDELMVELGSGVKSKKFSSMSWSDFKRVQDVFSGISKRYDDGTLADAMYIIKSMRVIDSVE